MTTKVKFTYEVSHAYGVVDGREAVPGHWEDQDTGQVSGFDRTECFKKVFLKHITDDEDAFWSGRKCSEEDGYPKDIEVYEYFNDDAFEFWEIWMKKED